MYLYSSFNIFINIIIYFKGDIKLPERVQEAMQMQVEAERKKRAAILESEGIRAADINIAEGKRQAKILSSGKFSGYQFSSNLALQVALTVALK
jgi:hypothetical protein